MAKTMKGRSPEAKAIWTSIHSEWTLSKLETVYLKQALDNLDSALYCEYKAKLEGLTLQDQAGRKYLNPLLHQAKISRNNYLRLLKLIGFEKVLQQKAKRRGPGAPTEAERGVTRYAEDQD